MTRRILFCMTLLILLCASGCGGTPDGVVRKYFKRIHDLKFHEAEKLCIGEARKNTGRWGLTYSVARKGFNALIFPEWDIVEPHLEFTVTALQGNIAEVTVSGKGKEFGKYGLVKSWGVWKIRTCTDFNEMQMTLRKTLDPRLRPEKTKNNIEPEPS